MATRRDFLATSALLVGGLSFAKAQDLCAVSTKDMQSVTSADQALVRLKKVTSVFSVVKASTAT